MQMTLVSKSDDDLIAIVKAEMKKFFLLDPGIISSYKIIKEKRATFIPSNDIIRQETMHKKHILKI